MVSVGLIWQFVETVLLRMSKVTKMSIRWSSNKNSTTKTFTGHTSQSWSLNSDSRIIYVNRIKRWSVSVKVTILNVHPEWICCNNTAYWQFLIDHSNNHFFQGNMLTIYRNGSILFIEVVYVSLGNHTYDRFVKFVFLYQV